MSLAQSRMLAPPIAFDVSPMLATSPQAAIAVDAGGRIVFANPAAARLADWIGPLVGLPVAVLLADWPRLSAPGGASCVEAELRRGDGSRIPVELAIGRWTDAGFPHVGIFLRGLLDQRASEFMLETMAREAADALAAVRAGEERLREIIELLPQAVCVFDAEDRYVLWNSAYAALYPEIAEHLKPGMPFVDILRVSLASGVMPEQVGDPERWLAERLCKHALPVSQEEQELRDGRWLRHDDRRTSDGGAIGMRIDITDLKRREESLRLLFESNPLPMLLLDADTLSITAANDAALTLYGVSRETLLARTATDLHVADERADAAVRFHAPAGAADDRQVWRHVAAGGAERHVLLFVRSLVHDGLPRLLVTVADVSDRIRAETLIRELAHHDPLTGLANRIRFHEVLVEALAHPDRRVAVHYLDLDGFKPVNDTIGHSGGDRLLCLVADRLHRLAGSSDLVARFGGDEFVLLQLGGTEDPAVVAARIVAAIDEPFDVDGTPVRIGVSVGAAVTPDDGSDPDALLRAADAALYRAKAAGRSTWRLG